MNYQLIRSKRKTLSIEIKPDSTVIVRAPYNMKASRIESFVNEKTPWIEKQLLRLEEAKKRQNSAEKLTPSELEMLAEKAKEYIPERAEFYAKQIGVTYGKITIRCQKTKWGSCSSKGNLNFNCLLMLTPPEVIDSVVVHELCHLKEMNHGKRFYAEVLKVYPDYHRHRKWLKENGSAILSRRPD